MGTFRASGLSRLVGSAAKSYIKHSAKIGFRGLGYVFNPVGAARAATIGAKGVAKGFMMGDIHSMGKASMKLLGASIGITYTVRAAKGRSIFRDSRGKRDIIPFVPFI